MTQRAVGWIDDRNTGCVRFYNDHETRCCLNDQRFWTIHQSFTVGANVACKEIMTFQPVDDILDVVGNLRWR